jgi:hypothetical protein
MRSLRAVMGLDEGCGLVEVLVDWHPLGHKGLSHLPFICNSVQDHGRQVRLERQSICIQQIWQQKFKEVLELITVDSLRCLWRPVSPGLPLLPEEASALGLRCCHKWGCWPIVPSSDLLGWKNMPTFSASLIYHQQNQNNNFTHLHSRAILWVARVTDKDCSHTSRDTREEPHEYRPKLQESLLSSLPPPFSPVFVCFSLLASPILCISVLFPSLSSVFYF